MWFQPGPRFSCSVKGPTQFTRHGRVAGCAAPLAAINRHMLCKCCLDVLLLHTAPIVGCVISPTAAACNLLLWGTALPGNAILTRSNTQRMHIHRCAAYGQRAGSGCTKKVFPSKVRLQWDSQAAAFSQRVPFDTSGPRTTNIIKCGVRGQTLEVSWSRHLERSGKRAYPVSVTRCTSDSLVDLQRPEQSSTTNTYELDNQTNRQWWNTLSTTTMSLNSKTLISSLLYLVIWNNLLGRQWSWSSTQTMWKGRMAWL